MAKIKDITGQRFGRLVVQRRFSIEYPPGRRTGRYICLCDCGNTTTVFRQSLLNGTTSSCRCLQKEVAKKQQTIHGLSRAESPTYRSWRAAKTRCSNPNYETYQRYGGRGIEMHPAWENSFTQFLADMGLRPKGTTLDRIDNNKGYEPGNCRWAVGIDQHNNKSSNHMLVMRGQEKTVAQWARELKMTRFKVLKLSRLHSDVKDPRS